MKWLKWTGVGLGAVVLLLAAAPLLISLDDYVPLLERELSARLGEPVEIGALRAAGLPLPHATASDITVGKAVDIRVGKVSVTPDLGSLFSSIRVIRRIEIDGLVLTQQGIGRLSALANPGGRSAGVPAAVRVESILLKDAVMRFGQLAFGPFDARLDLTADGSPGRAEIATRDGKLQARIRPGRNGFLLEASAKEWKPPVGPAVLFDELTVKGVATLRDVDLGEIRAKLYGGSIAGKMTAGWEKGVQLKGEAAVERVEIAPLLQALGRPATFSGRITAGPLAFSAGVAKAGQLAGALRLETPFEVQGGVLHGVDIGRAATSLVSRDGGKGGETRFDRLSGHFTLDRGTRRLTRLSAVSGSLAADGNVTVSPRDELSGRVNASMKAALVAAATVPLNVSGTVESPLFLPTGGTVAGAAVGTAVLGPGVGTSVGAKVGQWTENLFGGKKEKQ